MQTDRLNAAIKDILRNFGENCRFFLQFRCLTCLYYVRRGIREVDFGKFRGGSGRNRQFCHQILQFQLATPLFMQRPELVRQWPHHVHDEILRKSQVRGQNLAQPQQVLVPVSHFWQQTVVFGGDSGCFLHCRAGFAVVGQKPVLQRPRNLGNPGLPRRTTRQPTVVLLGQGVYGRRAS